METRRLPIKGKRLGRLGCGSSRRIGRRAVRGTQISRSSRSLHSNVQLYRLLGIAEVVYTQNKTDMPSREDVEKNSLEH